MGDKDNKPKLPPTPIEPKKTPSWQLPEGLDDHLEAGVIKTIAGVAVGGLVGVVLFRAGGGWRSASMAAGVGVALGSTFERARPLWQQQK